MFSCIFPNLYTIKIQQVSVKILSDAFSFSPPHRERLVV